MTDMTSTIELAVELTVAWLGNSNTRATTADVPAFLQLMHDTLMKLESADAVVPETKNEAEQYVPAISVRKSLASPDHIISLIDGKPYRALRRHLAGHGMTPDDYRKRYGLKSDYPMVAPSYSETRRALAKTIGLGRTPRATAPSDQE